MSAGGGCHGDTTLPRQPDSGVGLLLPGTQSWLSESRGESFFPTPRLLTLYKSPSVVSLMACAAVSSFTDSVTDAAADSFIKANTHPGALNSLRCRKDVIKPIF